MTVEEWLKIQPLAAEGIVFSCEGGSEFSQKVCLRDFDHVMAYSEWNIKSPFPTLKRLTQTRKYTNIYNNDDFIIYNVQMNRKTNWIHDPSSQQALLQSAALENDSRRDSMLLW